MLMDITGFNRLEYEDPRWSQLCHSGQILQLRGDEEMLEGFAMRLIENNMSTGNILVLMSQTSSRMRQILEKKGAPALHSIEQCCVALHFTGLLLNIIFSKLSSQDIRRQLSLSAEWPALVRISVEDHSRVMLPTGEAVVRMVLQDALEILCVPSPPAWMHDVIFCAANFLVCLLSTQLYHEHVRDDDANIFLSYLYAISDLEIRDALGPANHNSLQNTTPARLLTSLCSHVIALHVCPSSSMLQSMLRTTGESSGQRPNEKAENSGFIASAIQTLYRISGSSGGNAATSLKRANVDPSFASEARSGSRLSPPYPVSEKCMNLVLLLIYNRRQSDNGNPYREVLCMLSDEDNFGNDVPKGGLEMVPLFSRQRGPIENALPIDFRGLVNSLSKLLPSESSTLLL